MTSLKPQKGISLRPDPEQDLDLSQVWYAIVWAPQCLVFGMPGDVEFGDPVEYLLCTEYEVSPLSPDLGATAGPRHCLFFS